MNLAGRAVSFSHPAFSTSNPNFLKTEAASSSSARLFGPYRPDAPFTKTLLSFAGSTQSSPPQDAKPPPVRFECLTLPDAKGGLMTDSSRIAGIWVWSEASRNT